MATSRGLVAPINETEHSVSRISREGKKITYKLKVIQQPERARACGAGAKSSADRRPVDPPPVVELRVYESEPDNDMNQTDITFAYNANFFLFATLDNARPIAQPRVAGQPPTCPVLTGVPVAGIAYLDRPSQAGYFIFPDLSVRHEGFYRLNFNLYEEVKDGKDLDKDTPMPSRESLAPSSKPTAPKNFLNFRLEVKSTPFQVYSAKKFPGLATSTVLSRVVAEQGCRVRIRRDVRMRRRGDKGAKDFGEFDDDRVYPRSPRYTTPTPIERPRSTSNSTVDTAYPYTAQPQRRESIPDFHAAQSLPPPPPPPHSTFQHPAGPPPPPVPSGNTPGYLSFGSAPSYQTPQLPATPIAPHTPVSSHATPPHSRQSSNASERETISQPYPNHSHLPPILNPKPVDPPAFADHSTPDRMAYQPPQPATRPRTPSLMLPPISSLGQFSSPARMQKTFYSIETSLSKRSHDDSFGSHDHQAHKSIRADNEHALHNDKRELPESPRWEGSSMEYRRANGTMTTKVRVEV